jgi:hypothetical protein
MDGLQTIQEIFSMLGHIVRLAGFLVFGFAVGRFVYENYKIAEWQVKIALVLGFFGLAIALTNFASAGSAGGFALGAGGAMLMAGAPKKEDKEEAK